MHDESTARVRTEQVVVPGLYRLYLDGKATEHFRVQRTRGGVAVRQRFQAATVAEAKDYATKLDNEIVTNGPAALGDRNVTVEALADAFLEHLESEHGKLARNTVAQRRILLKRHVVPALGPKLKAADVQVAHLRQVVAKLEKKGLKGSSVRACIASASGMFSYGVRVAGCIPKNPCRDLERGELPSAKRLTQPNYLSVDQVESLLSALSNEFKPIAAACFYGALRISEALALRWQDLDTDARLIHVKGTKTEASTATIPLLPPLAEELAAHRKRQGALGFDRIKPEALIFQTVTGLPKGRRNAHRAISNAAVKTGITPKDADGNAVKGDAVVGPHDLRHSMASAAFGLGLSPVEVSHLLRHASPAVTLSIYSALTSDQAQALGSKLAGIGGAS